MEMKKIDVDEGRTNSPPDNQTTAIVTNKVIVTAGTGFPQNRAVGRREEREDRRTDTEGRPSARKEPRFRETVEKSTRGRDGRGGGARTPQCCAPCVRMRMKISSRCGK